MSYLRSFLLAIIVLPLAVLFFIAGCKKQPQSKVYDFHYLYLHSITYYDSARTVIGSSADSTLSDEPISVSGLGSASVTIKNVTLQKGTSAAGEMRYHYSAGHSLGYTLIYFPANDSIYFTHSVTPAPYNDRLEIRSHQYWTY